jgi:hypothetical protein
MTRNSTQSDGLPPSLIESMNPPSLTRDETSGINIDASGQSLSVIFGEEEAEKLVEPII